MKKEHIKHQIIDHFKLNETIISLSDKIEQIAEKAVSVLKKEGTIFWCGNGGSAGDSQHLAAELIGKYKEDRRPLKSIALTTDSSAITCISNDYSYDKVFERQIEGLGVDGDVLIGISTSGNSLNIINALKKCNDIGVKSICFLGKDGGAAKNFAEHSVIIQSNSTARIQEMHIMIGQILCDLIEHGLSLK